MAGWLIRRGHAASSSSSGRKTNKKQNSPSYLLATATGLLSSSCCVVQLFLNALSISCAGFSILDRYRPFFLCLTVGVIAASLRKYGLFTRETSTTVLIACLLSASPELLKIYNEGGLEFFGRGSTGRASELAVFELEMDGLSCQACANKVKLEIEKRDGVVRCDIFLEEMRAVVRSLPGTFEDEAELEALVVAAGSKYRGTVVKRYTVPVGGAGEKVEL